MVILGRRMSDGHGSGSFYLDAMTDTCRFIFIRWPSGAWTLALDRDYDMDEIESF